MSRIQPKKILIVRFSSIGDIVLTFPVVAALRLRFPDAQIDYVTKKAFASVLEACPELTHTYFLETSLAALRKQVPLRQYDLILDLHHNLRTRLFTGFSNRHVYRFPKQNGYKLMLTIFKRRIGKSRPVVNRYLEPLARYLGENLLQAPPNPFTIPYVAQFDIKSRFNTEPGSYIAVAIGAQFATKRMPNEILVSIFSQLKHPILLVGGPEDVNRAKQLQEALPNQALISAVGQTSLLESAWLVKNAKVLLTHDTGLMHIGACFELPLVVVWGNTSPDFGMAPFRMNQTGVYSFEVTNLDCRPCSKIGHQSCPKKHFQCMQHQDTKAIAEVLNQF
ncbi:MAG: hypothetical protein RLZZ301_797 [Bacteroidota bacterium]|jgi:heptosyltransferase-2